ncbi:hypothetical protein BaRGS_00028431 [Batillaria attramentaria]|uniref:Uncharacterized protein n=1 Tax=Batillaria attramentaria TaxID=370345 RepID=A0ABD0JZY5_9CAEN
MSILLSHHQVRSPRIVQFHTLIKITTRVFFCHTLNRRTFLNVSFVSPSSSRSQSLCTEENNAASLCSSCTLQFAPYGFRPVKVLQAESDFSLTINALGGLSDAPVSCILKCSHQRCSKSFQRCVHYISEFFASLAHHIHTKWSPPNTSEFLQFLAGPVLLSQGILQWFQSQHSFQSKVRIYDSELAPNYMYC